MKMSKKLPRGLSRVLVWLLAVALSVALLPLSAPAAQAAPTGNMMADEYELAYHIVQNLNQDEYTTYFRFSKRDPDHRQLIDLIRMAWPYQFTLYFSSYQSDTRVMYITIKREQDSRQSQQKKRAEEIAASIIKPNMSDRDKIKAIHDWIILQNTYNHNAPANADRDILPYTAYAVFETGDAVCAGYADAFVLMCRSAGLLALNINGHSDPSRADEYGHAWNKVLVDGEWLYIDCTWDDPDLGRRILYDYFLISEQQMAQDHYWDINELNKFHEYVQPQRPDYAETLRQMNLFQGMAGGDPQLDGRPNRAQAAVMMVRLLGAEQDAQSLVRLHPFVDNVPTWATAHVGWLYDKKYTFGTSATTFSPAQMVSHSQYLAFLLRAMGYEDGVDFRYEKIDAFALSLGIITQNQLKALTARPFLRADMVNLSYAALGHKLRGSNQTLLEYLFSQGVVARKSYDLYSAA